MGGGGQPRKRQHQLDSLQSLGAFCQDQEQESKLGAAHPVPQSRTASEAQRGPVCPQQCGAVGIAFSGQTGDLDPCPGPAAS